MSKVLSILAVLIAVVVTGIGSSSAQETVLEQAQRKARAAREEMLAEIGRAHV